MTQPTITTAGPADPNAPLAAKFYAVVSGLLGIVGVAAAFGQITSEQAASLSGVAAAATGLVGAVGTAVAAFRTRQQLKNGTFDAAPPNPTGDVFTQLNSLQQSVTASTDVIKAQVDDAVAHAQGQVAAATVRMQSAAAAIPGGALISGAVTSGPVGDLIQAVIDHRDA